MKKLLSILVLFLVPHFLFPQFINNGSVQVILKGKVLDYYTNRPVGVTLEFKTSLGKKFKIRSDSVYGTYQQVFQAGEEVEAILHEWNVLRETFTFRLPDTTTFAEIEKDFVVRRMETGLEAFKEDCFPTGSSELSPEGEKFLRSFDEILKFNRNVKFTIYVTSFDTYQKSYYIRENKQTVKEKGKKKTIVTYDTTVVEPSAEQIKALVDSRLSKVEKIVNSLIRAKGRLFVKPNYTSGLIREVYGTNQPDIVVEVNEMKNILEK